MGSAAIAAIVAIVAIVAVLPPAAANPFARLSNVPTVGRTASPNASC
jgi:hypothetical protein